MALSFTWVLSSGSFFEEGLVVVVVVVVGRLKVGMLKHAGGIQSTEVIVCIT